MSKNNIHVAVLIMMKNEEKRLHVSLASVIGYVDSIVAYDTGSTDNTLTILKDFSDKHNIPLRLKEGEFVNFSVSRNVSLDYADTFEDIDFILLLDVNDELRGGDKLRNFALEQKNSKNNAFLVCQHWWSGKYDKYFNNRFIRARKGWRYRGSVHEWLQDTSDCGPPVFKMPDDIIIYQDRTQDDDKSLKRYTNDKVLLLADYKKDPVEPRVLFYLAQTCSCLNQIEDSFYYNKLRTSVEGFQEEKFHAYLRCGELSERLNHSWHDSMTHYMKAFEHSSSSGSTGRVEPLLKIANYYKNKNNWILSFTFSRLACSLAYPFDAILFVDKIDYDYTRWHVLGIVAYYIGEYNIGKEACLTAIKAGNNIELDQKNLEFYNNKLKDVEQAINKKLIKQKIDQLNRL